MSSYLLKTRNLVNLSCLIASERIAGISEKLAICHKNLSNRKMAVSVNCKRHHQLAAFDFDQTVVVDNTDSVVVDLLPKEKTKYDNSIGWTEYMAGIFKMCHEHNISPQKIKDSVRCMQEIPGFVRLIKRLRNEHKVDLIIISDSNTVFIGEWLQAHGIRDCFVEIFTNPAQFDEKGLLNIQPYHSPLQTDCQLSAPNLCKGRVLERFVVEQDLRHNIVYDRIMYIGDGSNDVCPVLRLRPVDFACVRSGHSLEKSLIKNRHKMSLNAELIVWENGFDLLDQLEAVLTQCRYDKNNKEDT